MKRRTIEHFVQSDSGKKYTILEFQQYNERTVTESKQIEETVSPISKFITTTGLKVTQIDSKTFKIGN